MSRRIIPLELEPDIFKLHAEGKIAKEIKEWLKDKHDIEASHATVSRLLKQAKQDRAKISRKVYQREAEKTAQSDSDTINLLVNNCLEDYQAARNEKDMRMALQVLDRLQKLIELRKKFNGGDEQTINLNHGFSDEYIDEIRLDLMNKFGVTNGE